MAQLVRSSRYPAEIMQVYAQRDSKLGRNDPCHFGSAKKFKHCHGKNR